MVYKRSRTYDAVAGLLNMASGYGGVSKKRSVERRSGTAKATHYVKLKRNVIKQQATRSTSKTKGRKKVKSIVHRKKSVYVAPKLRKKIKKVIAGLEIRGTYKTVRQGSIGLISRNGTASPDIEYRVGNMGGYTSTINSIKTPSIIGSNSRWWFNQAMSGDNDFRTGDDFQFFTPLKILDAASVLWNQKVASPEYQILTGNLNTVHNQATGAPDAGTLAAPNVKGLKVHVIYSSVSFIIKNNTQRSMQIGMYKCVPNIKFPSTLPLNSFVNAVIEEVDNGAASANSALVSVVGPAGGPPLPKDGLVAMPQVQPNQFRGFRSEWKYEKVVIKIAPGETTTQYCQGPKDYLLDYNKLYVSGTDEGEKAYKQTSMSVMFELIPDLTHATANVIPAGQSGRWIPTRLANDKLVDPISIQWTETYTLGMPEVVGFQNDPASVTASGVQNLNKRLPRLAFGNFVGAHNNLLGPVYSSFDEENVAIAIPKSGTN